MKLFGKQELHPWCRRDAGSAGYGKIQSRSGHLRDQEDSRGCVSTSTPSNSGRVPDSTNERYRFEIGSEPLLDTAVAAACFGKLTGLPARREFVRRYMTHGRIDVVLPSVFVGRRRYTSERAIKWFLARVQEADERRRGVATQEASQ